MTYTHYKIVTYVPLEYADQVREEIGKAGGGKLGKYSYCSFSTLGTGRFRPDEGAQPRKGEIGKFEEAKEERIEITCHKDVVGNVVAAIRRVNFYEEIPLDIYGLEDW